MSLVISAVWRFVLIHSILRVRVAEMSHVARCSWCSATRGRTCSMTTLVSSSMRNPLGSILTCFSVAVVASVASILPLVALFQVFDGLSAITAGVLRAVGKQFTGALLNLSAYYVVGKSLISCGRRSFH